jgi:hypothetical protein
MALNDILVPRENALGKFDERVLTAADIGAVASTDARLTDARTPTSHTHGNITNAGLVGTTSGLPLKTGTGGIVEAGAFGTAAGQFAEGNHTHAASAITSGVLDLARQKVVELVPCDDDPANELDVSAYEQNGNIVAHFNLRADASDASMSVLLPNLAATAIGEVTLRVNRGGQGLEFTSVLIEVLDEADEQIFGTSEGALEIDADEELTFRWNNGRWDLDLRPNPAATTAVSIFKPNASGTLALTSDFAAPPAIGNTTPAAISGTTGTFSTLTANNGTLTASAPVLDLAQTWNNAAVTFTGLLANFTNTASATASRLIDLQVGGTTQFNVTRTGIVRASRYDFPDSDRGIRNFGTTRVDISDVFQFFTGGGGTGSIWMGVNAATPSLQIGGGSSTPGFSANTQFAVFIVREANDTIGIRRDANAQTFRIYNTWTSATNFERLNVRWASNELIIDAEAGSAGGTLRGIKLGSATTSLLGFYGATPVAQQAAVADATDAASTQARLNDLLARLRTLGLIAT